MTNIASVTEVFTHAAYQNTKAMLESIGHTVTGYTSATAVASAASIAPGGSRLFTMIGRTS